MGHTHTQKKKTQTQTQDKRHVTENRMGERTVVMSVVFYFCFLFLGNTSLSNQTKKKEKKNKKSWVV